MPSPILQKLVLISAIALPATALTLTAYLHTYPLPAQKTRTITCSEILSPSAASCASCRIVNPRDHVAWTDSYRIRLSKKEIGDASDEEILARLLKGYFGGWIFVPEAAIFSVLRVLGLTLLSVRFSGT